MKLRAQKSTQLRLLKSEKSAYSGELLKTRAGRSRARPLAVKETMHLVLRSTQAKGEWSFKRPKNEATINRIVEKFANKNGVRVVSLANVGNHLHMQIQLGNRYRYRAFIRAITGAIAMAITGRSRWSGGTQQDSKGSRQESGGSKRRGGITGDERRKKFWDYRPFTRIVQSLRAVLNLQDYVRVNQLEGAGYACSDARFMLTVERKYERERLE